MYVHVQSMNSPMSVSKSTSAHPTIPRVYSLFSVHLPPLRSFTIFLGFLKHWSEWSLFEARLVEIRNPAACGPTAVVSAYAAEGDAWPEAAREREAAGEAALSEEAVLVEVDLAVGAVHHGELGFHEGQPLFVQVFGGFTFYQVVDVLGDGLGLVSDLGDGAHLPVVAATDREHVLPLRAHQVLLVYLDSAVARDAIGRQEISAEGGERGNEDVGHHLFPALQSVGGILLDLFRGFFDAVSRYDLDI